MDVRKLINGNTKEMMIVVVVPKCGQLTLTVDEAYELYLKLQRVDFSHVERKRDANAS